MKKIKRSKKCQITILEEIRKELKLKIGDSVFFEIIDGIVILKKIDTNNKIYLKSISSTLSEWNSEEDEEAYNDFQKLNLQG